MFRLKMTLSYQADGFGQADQLSQVRRLGAALERVGETQSVVGLAGGGISALIDYDLDGDSDVSAHRSILEGQLGKRLSRPASTSSMSP